MAVRCFLLADTLLCMMNTGCSGRQTVQPRGSQFPRTASRNDLNTGEGEQLNPRVGGRSTAALEASDKEVKTPGKGPQTGPTWSNNRKRAYRRARRRAEQTGGTWYRGRWCSAHSLGTRSGVPTTSSGLIPRKPPPGKHAQRRLKIHSYNIGGITSECYDLIKDWLHSQCGADVVVFQETHHGLGRSDGHWQLPGWIVVTTADEKQRYSGLAVFLRRSVFADEQVSSITWIPGRLMHVRCHTPQLTLDLVAGYQWVWQAKQQEQIARKRAHFWTQLGVLLQGLPARNLLALCADMNTHCRPLAGHIGRGVLRTTRTPDVEFEELIRDQGLVLLNTWSRAAESACGTFRNGSVTTQIDFIATRKKHADALARTAQPMALDLAPWRLGPKHHAVTATLPWVPGWKLAPKVAKPLRFSLKTLRHCVQQHTAEAQELQQLLVAEIEGLLASDACSFQELNRRMLPHCQRLFPCNRKTPPSTLQSPAVKQAIEHVWSVYRSHTPHTRMPAFQRAAALAQRQADLRQAGRALRAAGQHRRRQWLEEQISAAETAASRNDLGSVYRVINLIDPKRKREKVRIRSQQGHLLSVEQEFHEIHHYFQRAFSASQAYHIPESDVLLSFTEAEICEAVRQLQPGKAVPEASLPADVWLLQPEGVAKLRARVFQRSNAAGYAYPDEATCCSWALLPKPGKAGRRPQDLRPLGLQDPCAKVLALVLRARVMPHVIDYVSGRPQFAYCPHKALDDAVCRVASHCRHVRSRIQHGTLSVHARREGARESTCFGGLMLSVDLSRAFDELPRWSLEAALTHAKVPKELQIAIISIHQQCKYTVRHGPHSKTFALEKGVRQGCVLSPLLFTLFSCWIYDQLAAATSVEWAEKLMTLYADDSHASFHIESLKDLGVALRTIRILFGLFASTGMKVNATKSCIVLGLRGSAARRWIKRHACFVEGQPALNLGVPGSPLIIPRVNHMVYLGVVVSYGKFETQTFEHRRKAAIHNRQRLLRVLHAKRLSIRCRVRLYVACVRSTLMFGLHAIGITADVLRRLESYDARALRAIANSPVHLTRESNSMLRSRLQVPSPREALSQMLRRRSQRSRQSHSISWFTAGLIELEQLPGESSQLLAKDTGCLFRGVACPDCGVYFTHHRHMRSHRARTHKRTTPTAPPSVNEAPKQRPTGVLSAAVYNEYALHGMPTCRFCGESFRRVEGLKKHINSGCPARDCSDSLPHAPTDSTPAPEVQVASGGAEGTGNEGLPSAGFVFEAQQPLFAARDFCSMLAVSWRRPLSDEKTVASLRTFCVFCGQWISTIGPGCKQHHRLMHQTEWQHATAAADRINSLGLDIRSPCAYCQKPIRDPRRHIKSCVPVFQASLAGCVLHSQALLAPLQDGGRRDAGGDTCHPGPDGDRPGLRAVPEQAPPEQGREGAGPIVAGASQGLDGGWSRCGSALQMGQEGRGQGSLASLELGKRLQPEETVGAKLEESGEPRLPGPTGAGLHDDGHPSSPQARSRPHPSPSRHQLRTLHLYFGTLMPAKGEGRGESLAGTLHSGHSQHGSEDSPAGWHRQGPEGEAGGDAGQRGAASQVSRSGMGYRRATSLGPGLGLSCLGSPSQEADCVPANSTAPLRAAQGSGPSSEVRGGGRGCASIQMHQNPLGSVDGRGGAVYDHHQLEEPGRSRSPPNPGATLRQCMLQTAWYAAQTGAGKSISDEQGPRAGVHEPGFLRVEAPLEPVSRLGLGRPLPPRAVHQAARPVPATGPALPLAKLGNPAGMNLCYANSCMQALFWLRELADPPLQLSTSAQAGLSVLRRKQQVLLTESIAFHELFRAWPDLNNQHDAGEFWQHLAVTLQLDALAGSWQARLTNPHSVVDQAPLQAPILLTPHTAGLQSMINTWRNQHATHAVTGACQVACLQICRYRADSAKNQEPIHIPPGLRVSLPHFCDPGMGTEVQSVDYRVGFLIFHIGETVHSGHYQAVLSVPDALTDPPTWTYHHL